MGIHTEFAVDEGGDGLGGEMFGGAELPWGTDSSVTLGREL